MTPKDAIDVSLHAFRREPWTMVMVVLAIGLGIGACTSMMAILRALSADPVPAISGRLFVPSFDPSPPHFARESRSDPADAFTWPDVRFLLEANRAPQQAASASARMMVRSAARELSPFHADGRFATAQFFPMFEAPFREGGGWSAQDDESAARVVVLNGGLARKLFGSASAIGQVVELEGTSFTVTGVLDDWHPRPLFYANIKGDGAFAASDAFFLPLSTAMAQDSGFAGGMSCWTRGAGRRDEGCAWLQFWIRVDRPAQAQTYRAFLEAYLQAQRDGGRPLNPGAPTLLGFSERMQRLALIPPDIALQSWLALGLLGVCIANASSLLVARILRRTPDIAVSRAIGASKADILRQFGAEACAIALAGAVTGMGVAALGVWSIRQRGDGYAQLVYLDGGLLISTLVLGIGAALLATCMPAIHATKVPPARALKAT